VRILVTGAAGFIGRAVSEKLLQENHQVIGLDVLNDYYDVSLKEDRLATLKSSPDFEHIRLDIVDQEAMEQLFGDAGFDRVVHLAAQAGVRYSIDHPHPYAQSNVVGFLNILEGCRRNKVQHLVFASTSSVYGLNSTMPFSEQHSVDHPVSLYAATKKANEVMAHSYAHLYRLPTTGLRFFTVYGPWMRPDMALYKFAKKIVEGEPIQIYNEGNMVRDFTYVDDVVEGIIRTLDNVATPDSGWSSASPVTSSSSSPYRIFNIGNGNPVPLIRYIDLLEQELGIEIVREYLPMQAGDVQGTSADVTALQSAVGYAPSTPVETGVAKFVEWFVDYHGIDEKMRTGLTKR